MRFFDYNLLKFIIILPCRSKLILNSLFVYSNIENLALWARSETLALPNTNIK
jgi:hypothetical protein